VVKSLKDTQHALKDLTTNVNKGVSRSLSGIDSMISRLMYTNPITGMLWSMGKGLTRDFWNIGAGAAQAGWGIAKGIGQGAWNLGKGAAGIINSAVNMFQKNRSIDAETDDTDEEIKNVKQRDRSSFIPEAKTVEEYKQEGLTTAEKIDEMHDWIMTKFPKQQAEQEASDKQHKSFLAKGLGGLTKTIEAVNKVITAIQNKQKLIVGGLLLGVLGIVGLAAWFKGGGFEKLLLDIIGLKKQGEKPKPQEYYKSADTGFNKKHQDRLDDISKSIQNEKPTGDVTEVKKAISANILGLKVAGDTDFTSGYSMKAEIGQPYRAPFDLKVLNWMPNERNADGIDMEVERLGTLTKKNAVIMNIESPTIVAGQTAKKGKIIGYVPKNGQIYIKDITKEEFDAYKLDIDNLANRSEAEKAKEIEEEQQWMNVDQSNKVRNAHAALKEEIYKKQNGNFLDSDGKLSEKETKNYVKNQVKSKSSFAAEANPEQTNNLYYTATPKENLFQKAKGKINTVLTQPEWDRTKELNQLNSTDNKINEQKNILQQQDKQEIENRNQNTNTGTVQGATSSPTNISVMSGNPDSVRPSNFMNMGEAQATSDNYLTSLSGE
jgi:hypothetical protein